MEESPINKSSLIKAMVFSAFILTILLVRSSFNDRTKMVFCDVGQGDATYIRIRNKIDLLVDVGPDNKILNCLGKHLPFYDHTLEFVILTHPQKDHIGGMLSLLDHYQVKKVYTTTETNPSLTFKKIKEKLKELKIVSNYLNQGENIIIDQDKILVICPPKELNLKTADQNKSALVFILFEKNKKFLFTSDISSSLLTNALNVYKNSLLYKSKLFFEVAKIPHHGSKNGLNSDFFRLADIGLGVISVGKKNPYGHPANEVINLLKALKIKTLRTDLNGDIVYTL